jgi:hypothetical protein
VLLVGGLALVAACSSDGDGGTTTTTGVPTTTAVPSTSSSAPTTTSSGGSTTSSSPVNTLPVLMPGQACAPGSDPDCIDPEGNGQYVYLIGGAACMASPIGGAMCSDLDGDGRAGYPDSG